MCVCLYILKNLRNKKNISGTCGVSLKKNSFLPTYKTVISSSCLLYKCIKHFEMYLHTRVYVHDQYGATTSITICQ